MAIEKYTSKCLVLESYDQGEHDRAYKVFTREFGAIIAIAKSVRKLESKLRAHMLPHSASLITLVQGREVWRLVGAEEIMSTSDMMYEVTTLLKRFIRGEGAHTALYDKLILFLEASPKYDPQKARVLLYFIILVDLGYADARVIGAKTLTDYITYSMDDLYTYTTIHYDAMRSHIHAVLKEMQL